MGAFWLQVMVQGAWGVVPVHLNELSPDAVRATMPGLTYQIGNFISAGVPWVLTTLAEANNKQYGLTMAVFIAVVAVLLAIVTALGPEAKGQKFGAAAVAAE
jgi:SHS family lactate transporter-like MFS transporter